MEAFQDRILEKKNLNLCQNLVAVTNVSLCRSRIDQLPFHEDGPL